MTKLDWKPTDDGKTLKMMGDNLIGRFTSFKGEVHIWAVSAALHAAVHGDITEVTRVVSKTGLGEGMQLNGLRAFFTAKDNKLPFDWKLKDKDTGEAARFVFNREKADALAARYAADKDATVALLMALTPWYKMAKEPEFKGFNLKQQLASLLKRATEIAADPEKKDRKDVSLDGIADLSALVRGGKAAAAAAGQAVQ